MERRKQILKLDSEAMKLARLMIETSVEDVSVIKALVDELDGMKNAVLGMRTNAEFVLACPKHYYELREGVKLANAVLNDREPMSEFVIEKTLDIDEGLNATDYFFND